MAPHVPPALSPLTLRNPHVASCRSLKGSLGPGWQGAGLLQECGQGYSCTGARQGLRGCGLALQENWCPCQEVRMGWELPGLHAGHIGLPGFLGPLAGQVLPLGLWHCGKAGGLWEGPSLTARAGFLFLTPAGCPCRCNLSGWQGQATCPPLLLPPLHNLPLPQRWPVSILKVSCARSSRVPWQHVG